MKRLICARDVEIAKGEGKKEIYVDGNTLITPSAKDAAVATGILFTATPPIPEPKEIPGAIQPASGEKPQAMGLDGEVIYQLLKTLINKGMLNEILESLKAPKSFEAEFAGHGAKVVRGHSVKYDVFDTGTPGAKVTYQELINQDEASMSAGFLTIDHSQFDWELTYQEIDYVLEGTLTVTIDGKTLTAYPGDVVYVPAGAKVTWGSPDLAKVFYVTYPVIKES